MEADLEAAEGQGRTDLQAAQEEGQEEAHEEAQDGESVQEEAAAVHSRNESGTTVQTSRLLDASPGGVPGYTPYFGGSGGLKDGPYQTLKICVQPCRCTLTERTTTWE